MDNKKWIIGYLHLIDDKNVNAAYYLLCSGRYFNEPSIVVCDARNSNLFAAVFELGISDRAVRPGHVLYAGTENQG